MSLPAERSLFAAKGRASAAGARLADNPDDLRAAEPVAPPSDPVTVAEAAVIAEKKAAVDHQPGSLLAFRLRSAPGKSALSSDIVAALAPQAGEESVAARAQPDAQPAADAATTPAPATAAAPSEEMLAEIAAAPASPATAGQMPTAVPATAGGRIDRPLFPQPGAPQRKTADEDGAERRAPLSAIAAAPRVSTLRTVLPAAAAVVAIAMVGWLITQSGTPSPDATPVAVAEDAPAAAATPEAVQPAAVLPAPDQTVDSHTAVDRAATADSPAAIEPPAPEAAHNPGAAPEAVISTMVPVASAPEPSVPALPADAPTFDVVRTEPGAPPVLAGRAAPGSQLIVLDNGAPMGTAIADANGEWTLVGGAPLRPGRHELSLALKTPEGSLVVEQADAEMAPTRAASSGLPIPSEKPVPGAIERFYVVQLASVPSPADAAREWARLQQAYPALLGQRDATIDAAEIGARGTFYRVRTGPFGERNDARALCRDLNGAGQECLVVRGAPGT